MNNSLIEAIAFENILQNIENSNDTLSNKMIEKNEFNFINLKRYKCLNNFVNVNSDLIINMNSNIIKSRIFYDLYPFRIILSDLVYFALQCFPNIIEYSIICENDKGISILKLGSHKQDGNTMASIINKNGEFLLNEIDILNLYIFNRIKIKPINEHTDIDTSNLIEDINLICELLCQGGFIPHIKTKFINKPNLKKNKWDD